MSEFYYNPGHEPVTIDERAQLKAEITLELTHQFNRILTNHATRTEQMLESLRGLVMAEIQNAGARADQRIDEISKSGAERIEKLWLALQAERAKVKELEGVA